MSLKLISAVILAVFLSSCSYQPLPEVMGTIDQARFTDTDDYYQFSAKEASPRCLIFYPGGRVDALAYAPYLQRVADAGFTSYLIKSPFDLAILDGDAADQITQQSTALCEQYLIAGHSLGGVVAADYVADNPDYGLLLLAAYPRASLIEHKAPVTSISASLDGLTTADKLAKAAHLLPKSTHRVEIVGGNHAQFGWYGPQDDDGTAKIDRAVQQQIVFDETLKLLAKLIVIQEP